jgi:hypothetical protein
LKKLFGEISTSIEVLELTKVILDTIIEEQSESIAEFKIHYRLSKKDRKLIQIMIRWKLNPKMGRER